MKLNKAILGGRLGSDPENKNGAVQISLATDDGYKGKDGTKIEQTNWHRVVAFGKLGEIIEKYCKKGDEIIIQGAIKYQEHNDKWYTSIVASDFSFVSSPKRNESQDQNDASQQAPAGPDEDDDLPF